MPNRSTLSISLSVVFLVVTTMLIGSSVQAQDAPADHFARGKKLVEDNCTDCMGGTQKGEEEGIRELEMAIQAHYEKPVEAYKALADAYANMAGYVGKDSEAAAKAFWEKEYAVYRKLYQLAPEDEEVLMDYLRTLTDPKDQIAICHKILSLNPKNADARFSLGDLLLQQDQLKEGMEEMKQAVTLERNPESVRNDAQRVIEGLDQHHCPLKNAAALNAEVFKAEAAATQGPGDPQPMAAFKKKFVAALEQHVCAAAAASPKSR
jgi:tetratricopeptide (TPR) repeat protein